MYFVLFTFHYSYTSFKEKRSTNTGFVAEAAHLFGLKLNFDILAPQVLKESRRARNLKTNVRKDDSASDWWTAHSTSQATASCMPHMHCCVVPL